MPRLMVLCLSTLLLAGCQTVAERRAEIDREDDLQCQEYGARRGTPAYTNCRLELNRIRTIELQAPRPVVVGIGPVWGVGIGGYCRSTPWGIRCY